MATTTTQLSAFARFCATETGRELPDQAALHEFSIADVRAFWSLFLRWSAPLVEGSPEPVCTDDDPERAVFFPALRLSYVENLLRIDEQHEADRPAVIARHATGPADRLTRRELRERTYAMAVALTELGLLPGDRAVAVVHNDADTIVAGLATLAVGATLSTVAPDLGTPAVLDRFGQLEPKLLIAHAGERGAATASLAERIGDVARSLPSLRAVVVLDDGALPDTAVPVHRMADLVRRGLDRAPTFRPPRLPFNHPLFILFSSGTTGPPKCLIHGAGGTLLEHLKEHRLHGDLRPSDRLFFQTSAAWMMWNWQLSALACGTAIVLYDGLVEPETLWRIAAEERVTVLGTSPSYLQLCQDSGLSPGESLPLADLRAIQSTGSILYDHQFDWVAAHVGPQPLQSISGGTDIVGCFVLGSPNLPVRRGESQCRSLGLDVQAVSEDGTPLIGAVGELVCRTPFPSRPLGLYGDPDGERFHETYFARHPGMWTHGDLIEFSPEGTARMHGRSDGVMNIRGIRIGPAEIYRVLQDVPEVREALAVEQRLPDRAVQSRLILLAVPATPGALDEAATARIRRLIARRLSPAHVPALIVEVDDLPVTLSGKRSETAARDAVNGRGAVNADALRNPDSLTAIAAAVRRAEVPAPHARGATLEDHLLEIWEGLLGVSGIGLHDDFFDVGGDSLLALQLAEELRARLGRDVPVARLFSAPTPAGMAATLREPEGQASRPYRPRQRPAWQVRGLEWLARLLAAPAVALYRAGVVEYETPGELLALVPGRVGMLLRRGWYSSTLEACGVGLFVKPRSIITYPNSRIGDRCAIGTGCNVGWVDMGDHTMLAPHCVVVAGNRQHGIARLDRPMRDQPGTLERVRIGEDVWVGAGSVVMADVAPHTIVTPGSTVDRTFQPYAILTGVPARPSGSRLARGASEPG